MIIHRQDRTFPQIIAACFLAARLINAAEAQPQSSAVERSPAATANFPPELVNWSPRPGNPVFAAEGPGHWDVKIRERGWILREGDTYKLWFTGYNGTRDGIKLVGYAASRDGIQTSRSNFCTCPRPRSPAQTFTTR